MVVTGAIVIIVVLLVHKIPIGMRAGTLAYLAHLALFTMSRQSNAKERQMEIIQMEQVEVKNAQLQHHSGMATNVLLVSYQSIGITIHLYAKTARLHTITM